MRRDFPTLLRIHSLLTWRTWGGKKVYCDASQLGRRTSSTRRHDAWGQPALWCGFNELCNFLENPTCHNVRFWRPTGNQAPLVFDVNILSYPGLSRGEIRVVVRRMHIVVALKRTRRSRCLNLSTNSHLESPVVSGATWNARSRPESDDIDIQLLNLLVGLVNETLEVMVGCRNLEFHLSPRQHCVSCKIEPRSRSLSSLEKESERLQHLAVPCASLAVPSTTQAKGTLNSRGTSLSTPRGSVVGMIRRSAFIDVDLAEVADLSEHGAWV